MTPDFINRMLERQPKEEAIIKRDQRKAMTVQDVPPTAQRK